MHNCFIVWNENPCKTHKKKLIQILPYTKHFQVACVGFRHDKIFCITNIISTVLKIFLTIYTITMFYTVTPFLCSSEHIIWPSLYDHMATFPPRNKKPFFKESHLKSINFPSGESECVLHIFKKKKELYQNNSSDHYGKYYTNKKKTFYNQSPNIDILLNFDGQIQKHETALRRKECL